MRRSGTVEDYEKWVKRGRGQGDGANYSAWLNLRDVPSRATRSRLVSRRFGRPFYFMSNGELITFFILEWDDSVIQIREQYPLDPTVTQQLACKHSIRHPAVRGENIVMTTDFLVDYNVGGRRITKAIQVKHRPEDVADNRTQEKLRLEALYWEGKSIPSEIVFSANYSPILVSNLRQLFRWRNQKVTPRDLDRLSVELSEVLDRGPLPSSEIRVPRIRMADADCIVSVDEALKTLIAHKRIPFDIHTEHLQQREFALLRLS